MDVNELRCGCTIEWANDQKKSTRRVKYTLAYMKLLRNEFRELMLQVESGKIKHMFQLENVNIHKKFVAEGKATIHFNSQNVTIMFNNAPAANLIPFLKTLFIKLTSKKQSPKIKLREQLLSGKPHVLEEISPVNKKDVIRVQSDIQMQEVNLTALELKKRRTIAALKSENESKRRCLISLVTNSKLNEEQQEILNTATSKVNIFFSGSAGTGKSYLLKLIISALPPDETVATASTGAAACLIGIGGGDMNLQRAIELASRPAVATNWRRCKYLVIDEISMIDGDYFEKIEHIARAVRKSKEPFGGIKLIFCGDFLQLPPVTKTSKVKFCFQTDAWKRCQLKCFYLRKVYRQADSDFVSILNHARVGKITKEIEDRLKATAKNNLEKDGIVPTQLCCKTIDAKLINDIQLQKLEGKEYKFIAIDNGNEKMLNDLTPVPHTLILKEGAQIMLLKNIKISEGLVNGARGVIQSFSSKGLPIVQFRSGIKREINTEKWIINGLSSTKMTREQLPLRLAWAFSIHKSQGLTLDCVEMSLSGVFEAGQAYVALSRAQSLNCLRICDFEAKQVWANPDAIKFYRATEFNSDAIRIRAVGKLK